MQSLLKAQSISGKLIDCCIHQFRLYCFMTLLYGMDFVSSNYLDKTIDKFKDSTEKALDKDLLGQFVVD